MRADLPSGTVTFLFTDVEGSTKLLHELGAEAYAQALAEHRLVLRRTFQNHGGVEVDTQGDAFFYAFPTAPGAIEGARQGTEALAAGPISVRIGIHTGTPLLTEEGYVGEDVHRAARIAAVAHGGQVVVSASAASLVGDALVDLGEHRLKDLLAAERIYQLGGGDFPPLRSLHRTNLPVPATPFLGRERELAEVVSLLEGTRLLTLTGPGGTGKTRLGLQAAAEASDRYPDGVFWVPLAPLRDPALVLPTAAQILGSQDDLAEHIADKTMLLLFDNFEHVVEAADGLAEVLSACPKLRLLATSRELLRLPGEQAFPVPPLEPADGTELFLARAHAVEPTFVASAAVGELCVRLDQLPLALELAAARVGVLSPEQLLERLSGRLDLLRAGRGVEARQQTLRTTIAWSHDLLDADEQQLFARLSVFRGGCTLDAADAVCDADLDTLQSLVDKSLVRLREHGRFWMLETIREFAAERLEQSGEAAELQRRHGAWFLALAEEAYANLLGSPGDWLDRLELEHDNFRAALDRYELSGDIQSALHLAGALHRFWAVRGHLAEGSRRLERLVDADARPTAERGRALLGAAALAMSTGDIATLSRRAEEALAFHREAGDAWGVAYAQMMLGFAAADRGDYAAALAIYEEAAQRFREVGDQHYAVLALNAIAYFHGELGDVPRERSIHEETLRLARLDGNERVAARALYSLSNHALNDGRPRDSIALVHEALETYVRFGETAQVSMGLRRFAWALAAEGRADSATQLLARAEGLREEIGAWLESWTVETDEETRAMIRDQIGDAAFAEAWERGRQLTVDEAVALALGEAD